MARLLIVSFLIILATACAQPQEAPASTEPSTQPKYGGQLNARAGQDPYDWDITYTAKTAPMGDSMENVLFRWGEQTRGYSRGSDLGHVRSMG